MAGLLDLIFSTVRPWRTNWLMVGIEKLSLERKKRKHDALRQIPKSLLVYQVNGGTTSKGLRALTRVCGRSLNPKS